MTKHQDFEQTLDQALQKNIYVVLNAKKHCSEVCKYDYGGRW